MIKATIGLIILAVVVALWLLRTGARVGRDVYDAAAGRGMFPPLGKGASLRHQATELTRSLLERSPCALDVHVDSEQVARQLVDAYYSGHPSFFTGHYRQDPHPLSLAAAALALEVYRTNTYVRSPLPFALLLVMGELEERGHLYAFNALDETLLKEAARVALVVADKADQAASKMGLKEFLDKAPAALPAAATATTAPSPAPASVARATVDADNTDNASANWIFGGVMAVILLIAAATSNRQPPVSLAPVVPAQVPPPTSAVAPTPAPAPTPPTPELRELTVLPGVRVTFLADNEARDVSSERLLVSPGDVVARSAVAFEYKGSPYLAEFTRLSAPNRFVPAFRLAEAVQQDGPDLLKNVGAALPIENARADGKRLAYGVPGQPPCIGTLRVAGNRLIDVRVCGTPEDAVIEQILSSIERDNPSKDIETDSTEDALNMTFRAIRDQLNAEAKAAFVAEQRAWITQKELVCRPHGVLSEVFFACLDRQVSDRLAELRARVAAGLPAESLISSPEVRDRDAAGSPS